MASFCWLRVDLIIPLSATIVLALMSVLSAQDMSPSLSHVTLARHAIHHKMMGHAGMTTHAPKSSNVI